MLLEGLFPSILNGEFYLSFKYDMQKQIIWWKLVQAKALPMKSRPNFLWSNIMITKYFITWLYESLQKRHRDWAAAVVAVIFSCEPMPCIYVQRVHWINIVKLFNCAAFLFAPNFQHSSLLIPIFFGEYFPIQHALLFPFTQNIIVVIFQPKLFERVLYSEPPTLSPAAYNKTLKVSLS